MSKRAALAAIAWLVVTGTGFYVLGGMDVLIAVGAGLLVAAAMIQAVWFTASWVETGDPRWWRAPIRGGSCRDEDPAA